MRVGIAGAGAVGLFIADDLRATGHEVLIIEQQPRTSLERADTAEGIEWYVGDACEVSTLQGRGRRTLRRHGRGDR